jgi:iron complex outermembrane receptor protein
LDKWFNDFSFSCGASTRHGKWNYKVNIAKGFRMPIAKELAANGVNYHNFSYEIGNPNLKSETSYQADCQIDYLSRLLTVSVSPFAGYFANYIFLNPTPRFDRLYGNGNQIYNYQQCKVLRYGGEAEVRFVADNRYAMFHNSKIELALNGEFVKARQLDGDKKGYSLPFAPPATIGFDANYAYRVKHGDDDHKKFKIEEYNAGFYAKQTSKVTDIVPPEKPTDGYHLLSVSIGCTAKISGTELQLSSKINNLLNTVYFDHTSYYRLINVPGQGRCVIISLTAKF